MLVYCLHCGWIEIANAEYIGPVHHGYQLIIADAKAHSVINNPRQIEKCERKAEMLQRGLQLPSLKRKQEENVDAG